MKKILCVLLSALMLMSFSVIAFAEVEDEPVVAETKTLEELLALLLDAESTVPFGFFYTDESWKVFKTAYDNAWEIAFGDVAATDAEYTAAYVALEAGIEGLEEVDNFFIALFHNIIQYIISVLNSMFGKNFA